MMLIDEIRTGKIGPEFLSELEGVALENRTAAIQPHVLAFTDEVLLPFVRALLRRLKECFEESTPALVLAAIERLVLPALVATLPMEFQLAKSQVQQVSHHHQ
jgi:hypothetical protein